MTSNTNLDSRDMTRLAMALLHEVEALRDRYLNGDGYLTHQHAAVGYLNTLTKINPAAAESWVAYNEHPHRWTRRPVLTNTM